MAHLVTAIIKPFKLEEVKEALRRRHPRPDRQRDPGLRPSGRQDRSLPGQRVQGRVRPEGDDRSARRHRRRRQGRRHHRRERPHRQDRRRQDLGRPRSTGSCASAPVSSATTRSDRRSRLRRRGHPLAGPTAVELGDLARRGVPRLLLVSPASPPPVCTSCLEDWARLPVDDADLRARLDSLAEHQRAHAHPSVDEFGVLRQNGSIVFLSPREQAIAEILIAELRRRRAGRDLRPARVRRDPMPARDAAHPHVTAAEADRAARSHDQLHPQRRIHDASRQRTTRAAPNRSARSTRRRGTSLSRPGTRRAGG